MRVRQRMWRMMKEAAKKNRPLSRYAQIAGYFSVCFRRACTHLFASKKTGFVTLALFFGMFLQVDVYVHPGLINL